MPLRKHLKRLKDDVKEQLGLGSRDASSTSVPKYLHQGSGPETQSSTTPPSSGASATSSLAQPTKLASSSTRAPLVHHSTASPTLTFSIPTAIPDAHPLLASHNPLAPSHSRSPQDGPLTPGTSAKKAAWAGLKGLLRVLEPSAAAFGPLRSAIGGLNQCIGRAAQGRGEFDDLRTAIDSLLGGLCQFFDGPAAPKMTTSMNNLCNGIIKELSLIKAKQQRGAVQRYISAIFDADEVLKCYQRIQSYLDRLMLNANINTWKTIDEQATEARLKDLCPTHSAVYNSAKSEIVGRGQCTPGTREEEISKLLSWARDQQAGDVYWMDGMAGTGKTTLAYSLCGELDKSAELGASFFCSRLLPECRHVEIILPAIAYQLARFSRPFRYALSQVLEANPDVHHRVLKMQFESIIAEPLLQVKHTLPSDIVVVIDALDECEDEKSVGKILDLLLGQTTSDLPIRFLVSSRPEPEIYSRMMKRVGSDSNGRLVLHELEAATVNQYIKTYLQEELKDVPLTNSQLSALVAHSGVLFIYAATAARYITDGLDLGEHQERLEIVLGLSPSSSDGSEHGIDALYTTVLRAASKNPKFSIAGRAQVKTILDTIVCAQEPMTTDALAGLLKMECGERVEALLRPLRSVVNISEASKLVTTLHASFSDFLLARQRSIGFHCDPGPNHQRLAQACLELIKGNNPQFNICGLESSFCFDDDVPNLVDRVDRAVSPQLFYACQYWGVHLELGEREMNMAELLYDFLSKRLLLWMEVLNLKKSMHVGARIIQRAHTWSKANGEFTEMVRLADDAWRFVTIFASHAVSRSTPHIYVSMLPFWPGSEPITKHYMRGMPGLKPHGQAMTRRQLRMLATWSLDEPVRVACCSTDGSRIAVGSGRKVFIIDGTTGKQLIAPLEGHTDSVSAVCFSLDGTWVASGSLDNTVRLWDARTGTIVIGPLKGHTHWVSSVSLSSDKRHIVSGSWDNTIRVWDVQRAETALGPLEGLTSWVESVCFSPDGTHFVSGSYDKTIRVWDARTGKTVVGPLQEHTGSVNSVCFSPDSTRFASGSEDNTVLVWDARNGQTVVGPLEGHNSPVLSVCFSPDGTCIVSGSANSTIRVWNSHNGEMLVAPLIGHNSAVTSACFSPDSTRIISGSWDGTIRVWDIQKRDTSTYPLEGHANSVMSVCFSPDGTRIGSCSLDNTVRVWDARKGEAIIGPLKGHPSDVYSVCFSPDGGFIASGSYDKTIRVWDTRKFELVGNPLEGHTGLVSAICFSHDSAYIASGSWDNTIRVWGVQSGKTVVGPFKGHTNLVTSVCFSPYSAYIVSGSEDNTIRMWDAQTGEAVTEPLEGHTDSVNSVCFSPDGTRIVSGSQDNTIRVWDARSGKTVLGPLIGHTGSVNSVSFSHNGTRIVSGSADNTVRVWEAQTGEKVDRPFHGHTRPVTSVSFSPNDTQIVSGSQDNVIRVWDINHLLEGQGPEGLFPPNDELALTPSFLQSWLLSEDGWASNAQSHPLAWVPPDLHAAMLRPHNQFLISPQGSFQLDFDTTKLGDSWTKCYSPCG